MDARRSLLVIKWHHAVLHRQSSLIDILEYLPRFVGGNFKADVVLKIKKLHRNNYKTMRDVNLNAFHVSFARTF